MKKLLAVVISLFLLTSCGDDFVAQVGKIKVTQGEFGFYLSSIKKQMQGTELKTDNDWETQEIEGRKAIEVAREKAMDIAVKNALYIEGAKAHGMTLEANERMIIDGMKAQLVESYGGQSAYENYLKKNNITDKFMNMMLESSAFHNKIMNYVKEEGPLTDEEIYSYYETNREEIETRYRKAKHILILTTEQESGLPMIKSEQDKARREAERIHKRVKDGEDFDTLMHELSQDPGLATAPDGYVFTTDEMVKEFETEVDSLAYDEIGYCESEYGCHIIKRIPLSYEDVKDKLTDEIYEKRVDQKVLEWAEKFGVETVKYEEKYMEIS